jgi:hypothetical protein
MDPVSLILAALVAGAADAAKDTASAAVKDAYSGLKALLKRHFKGEQAAETALEQFEKDPDTWEKPLARSVADSGAGGDAEIEALAKKLLELAPSGAAAAGKYNVDARGAIGPVIGDDAVVDQHFDVG